MSLCFAEDVRGKPSTVVVVDYFVFFFGTKKYMEQVVRMLQQEMGKNDKMKYGKRKKREIINNISVSNFIFSNHLRQSGN